MSPTTTESDALTIARWCWPRTIDAGDGWIWIDDGTYTMAVFDPESADVHGNDQALHGVRDAERVLIERGHAEAYGRALLVEVDPLFAGLGREEHIEITDGRDLAVIATAPLDARVRALAWVIRALPAGAEPSP